MQVKSYVFEEYEGKDRYVFEFEHNGVTWFKFLDADGSGRKIMNLLNSVIEDTIARTR